MDREDFYYFSGGKTAWPWPGQARPPQGLTADGRPAAPCSRAYWRDLTSGHAPWPFGDLPDPGGSLVAGADTPESFAAAVNAGRPSTMQMRRIGGARAMIRRQKAAAQALKNARREELRRRVHRGLAS